MPTNFTLTNIQIKNKIKNFKDWYANSWNTELLNGETVYIRIIGEELSADDSTLDTVKSGLPVGIYSKTGDGSTSLGALPWNNNAKEMTESLDQVEGDISLLQGTVDSLETGLTDMQNLQKSVQSVVDSETSCNALIRFTANNFNIYQHKYKVAILIGSRGNESYLFNIGFNSSGNIQYPHIHALRLSPGDSKLYNFQYTFSSNTIDIYCSVNTWNQQITAHILAQDIINNATVDTCYFSPSITLPIDAIPDDVTAINLVDLPGLDQRVQDELENYFYLSADNTVTGATSFTNDINLSANLNMNSNAVLSTDTANNKLIIGSANYSSIIEGSASNPKYKMGEDIKNIVLDTDYATDSSDGIMRAEDYTLLHELDSTRINVVSNYTMPTPYQLKEGAISIIVAES